MSYQNPLNFQMQNLSKEDEDKDFLSQPQPTVSSTATPSLKETKVQTTPSVSDQQKALTAPQVAPLPRSSVGILEGAGIASAKDVLKSVYIEKPQDILEKEGISRTSILEDYQKELQKQKREEENISRLMQVEQELQKREKEFINNYKLDIPQYDPYSFEKTKFGDLSFKESEFSLDPYVTYLNRDTKQASSFGYGVKIGNDDYIFMPEEFPLKGLPSLEGGTDFNTAFLDKKTWEKMFEVSQPIDLSSLGTQQIKGYSDWIVSKPNQQMNRGFLFKKEDFVSFSKEYLNGNHKEDGFTKNPLVNKTSILGIAEINGQLVYVKDNVQEGRTTVYDIFIDKNGSVNWNSIKEKGGLVGDVARGFSKIPFGPEIAFVASGGNPAIYASFKALEVAGKGGTLSDVVKGGTVAYASAAVAPKLSSYGNSLGASIATQTGINTAVANTIGNAVVFAGFSGFMAAAQGQNINDAMLTGAISGGVNANASTITSTVFGGTENVASLAKAVNLTTPQFERIFAGSIARGTVASAVHGQDFLDAFKESLIVQGVSQASANSIANNLDKTMDPKKRAAIIRNARTYIEASARAAVRGESIEDALKRVTPYVTGQVVGETIGTIIQK
jgi:hypothetical protein